MKSRILFVDDNPLILQGLSRSLHSMRANCDFEFAESGSDGLALMAREPFDAVVSDMKMPGMNGAEFLTQVMHQHPHTVRLVLSGHADQDLIYRCVGVAHQCLSKPCDSETLKRTIRRALDCTRSFKNEAIKKTIARMDRIPTVPSLYCELVQELQSPDASLEAVAAVVRKDPGVTAKLLQLVNSSFFGLSRAISNPLDAITYLGVETLKSLVLSLSAFSQYEKMETAGVSLGVVWQHSLRTAEIARGLVRGQGLSASLADTAFVGGLLHDVGRLVLACNCPADYSSARRKAAEKQLPIEIAEEQIFGCNHADVGGYLLGLWGLPATVVDAISFHHVPSSARDEFFTPLTAVHIANVLDLNREGKPSPGGPRTLDETYLSALGLETSIQGWREILEAASAAESLT